MTRLDVIKEFNEFRQSPPGTTMCPAPLINLHFSQLGVVTACCFNRTLVLGVYPKDSVDTIWNGAPARELREALANNDLSKGCEKCMQQIEARDFGGSHAVFYTIFARHMAERQRELGMAPDVDQSVTPMPMKLEFNIHNSCNLECIMCHGLASSAIARRREAQPAMPNPYDEAFVDQLEQFLPHVVEADFMGGEPFLVPAYRQIWERIARVSPKTKVLILTNGTLLDDKMKELLGRLNCSMHVSIDSDVKKTYETIRKGASFDQVMAHCDYYREMMKDSGHPLVWRYCPMRINWRELPQTVRNCNANNTILHFNQLDSPINFSLTTLPYGELEEVVQYLGENGPEGPVTDIEHANQRNWVEMVARFRGFLEPANRRNGLIARLDTAAAVVSQYSNKRAGALKKRLALVESESVLTDAVKSFVITRLNVDQAVAAEPEVSQHILDRLTSRRTELFELVRTVPAATFARIFLNELVRTYSGVWGVYTAHDENAFNRIAEMAQWVGELPDPLGAVRAIAGTPPAELYRLIGLSTSLAEAKARFGGEERETKTVCEPDADLLRVERWLDGLAKLQGDARSTLPRLKVTASNARLLFVLDNDYGELTTLMYLLLGQPLADRSTLLLPPRLYEMNGDALPGRTFCWDSEADVMLAVDAHAPDVVLFCSGYLLGIHELLPSDALERLVGALRADGCQVVTADPYLGILSQKDPREIVAIDIPADAHATLREAKATADARLHTNLVPAERIFRDCYHLYPSYPHVPVSTAVAADGHNLSFYNPKLVPPPEVLPGRRDVSRATAAQPPHWVFIVSAADLDTQGMFEGSSEFAGIVAEKLQQAVAAGRRAVLIGPEALIKEVSARTAGAGGVELLAFCPFKRVIALLLTAEYAFYWNVVSHTILVRLFNGLPVVLFDRGHLARAITPMYDRVVAWYYQGWEPPYLDHRNPLDLEALRSATDDFRNHADRIRRGFQRAPAPERLIDTVLAGGLRAGSSLTTPTDAVTTNVVALVRRAKRRLSRSVRASRPARSDWLAWGETMYRFISGR